MPTGPRTVHGRAGARRASGLPPVAPACATLRTSPARDRQGAIAAHPPACTTRRVPAGPRAAGPCAGRRRASPAAARPPATPRTGRPVGPSEPADQPDRSGTRSRHRTSRARRAAAPASPAGQPATADRPSRQRPVAPGAAPRPVSDRSHRSRHQRRSRRRTSTDAAQEPGEGEVDRPKADRLSLTERLTDPGENGDGEECVKPSRLGVRERGQPLQPERRESEQIESERRSLTDVQRARRQPGHASSAAAGGATGRRVASHTTHRVLARQNPRSGYERAANSTFAVSKASPSPGLDCKPESP